MTLIEEAVRAEDISNALTKYRAPNPDFVLNINAAIAELAGLGSALRDINRLLEDHGEHLHVIEDDLKLVHESISFLLADTWHIIGTLGERPDSPLNPEDFRRNWRKIIRYNHDRGRQDFSARLEKHKKFLLILCRTLQSHETNRQDNAASRRDELRRLRLDVRQSAHPAVRRAGGEADQNPRTVEELSGGPAVSTIVTKRSYERHRDLAPKSPSDSGSSSSPFAMPLNPLLSPPTSPTTTFSAASQVSSLDREGEHWALQVFRDPSSWTPLPVSKERSEYHDAPGQPRYDHPGESYEEVVVLGFPPDPPALRVSLFCRRRDWRSKLCAQWKDRRGKPCIACLPLNMLKIIRIGPMLHFCRRMPDGKTNLAWLSLKFTAVERLVLFGCTFLSMRAHDGRKPENPVDDWQFDGELVEYAGKIQDNGFSHALRILRDKTSKAVRLQASVFGGQLDKTPVWTAFITHYVASRTWCQHMERNIVCLRELRPSNFSSNYEFQRLPNGAFVLSFDSKEDAKDFVGCMDDLGREYRRTRA